MSIGAAIARSGDVSRPSLLILDCDGVLIDSEALSAEVLLGEFAAAGFPADQPYFFSHCLGRSFSEVERRVRANFGRPLPEGFEARYKTRLLSRFASDLLAMRGARALLQGPPLRYVVATGSSPDRARASLEVTGLWPFVEGRLFCAAQVARGKPAPDLLLLAAATCGAAAGDCLVIEDADMGVAAAQAAGMAVWRFTGGSHFRDAGGQPARSLAADLDFDDLADLPGLIARL
jgi:HAD superfamily hydrolase (TIGR01509 family)